MKQLILTLALVFSFGSYTQIAPPRKTITLNLPKPSPPNMPLGPGMMIGGATFVVAGILTPPMMIAGSTTKKQPVYKQPRMLPIVSGALIFTIGVGITLGQH